jgi:hypothetical protein
MTMRSSDATFLRREVLPILDRASILSPDAKAAHDRLTERLEHEDHDPEPPAWEVVPCRTIHGEELRLAVDGIRLPYIEAWRQDWQDKPGVDPLDAITLLLDGRMSITVTEKELGRWLWFLANAMAVAGGRTCHGAHSYLRNPHGMSGAGGPQG